MCTLHIMEEIRYQGPDRLFWRTRVILLAVDGSDPAASAATVAFELAETTKAKVLIIHVVNLGTLKQVVTMSGVDPITVEHQYMQNGQKLLEGYKEAASEFDLNVELILEKGLPSDSIIRVAKERKADVIVMGSRGYTGDIRTGVGSATERVVRSAHCAVLIIK